MKTIIILSIVFLSFNVFGSTPFHLQIKNHKFNNGDINNIPIGFENNVIPLFSKHVDLFQIINDTNKNLIINSMVIKHDNTVKNEEFQILDGSYHPKKLEVKDLKIPAKKGYYFNLKFFPIASHERKATLEITYNGNKKFLLHLKGKGGSNANLSTKTLTLMDKVLGGADLDEMVSGAVVDQNGNTYFYGNNKMIAGADSFNNDLFMGQIKADGSLGWLKVWYGKRHDLSIDPGQNGESGGSADSITMDDKGYIYYAGVTTKTSGSNYAALIIKVNPKDGSIIWEKVWRPEFKSSQIAWQRADAYSVFVKGNLVFVTGSTLDNATVMFLVLNKKDGSLFTNKAIDLFAGYNDRGFTIKVDNNNNAYIGGSANGRAMLMKLSAVNTKNPKIVWAKKIDAGVGSNVNSMDLDKEGNIYVSVDIRGAKTSFAYMKVSPDGKVLWGKENASNGQKNNIMIIRVLGNSLYAGGRVGIGNIKGVVGYDTQFGDGYLVKSDLKTGKVDWSMFYYSGKQANQIAGYFVKGLGLIGKNLYIIGHMWSKRGDRYNGYWYDGVQELTDFSPVMSDIDIPAKGSTAHMDLKKAKVEDASSLRKYIDAPMGKTDVNGDKRKFTYQDSDKKHKGHGPDNDLSFIKLELK